MSVTTEILPDSETAEFIVSSVLRPMVEARLDEGHRCEVLVTFLAGKTTRRGPCLGSVGRAETFALTVSCASGEFTPAVQLTCECRPLHRSDVEGLSWAWRLTGVIRRDERGMYLSRRQVVPIQDALSDSHGTEDQSDIPC